MTEHALPIFIETLKQMYMNKTLTIAKIKAMLNDKVITIDEYNYILGKEE